MSRPPRRIASVEPAECSVCRRPVALLRSGPTLALMEPGTLEPHRCPPEALTAWRARVRLARLGDPRGNPV